ncbi:MAG: zinc-ribbon domain-containing protein, partial [Polyangiales bacterium]
MRFVCDHCKAKYSIADEKIRGKTMRMACRKCGHVLAIRGEGAEAHLSAPPPTVEEKLAAQIAESIHPGAAAAKERQSVLPVVPKAPAAPRIGAGPRKVP